MTMEAYLEERDHRRDRDARLALRDAAERVWLDRGRSPEDRLLRFDTWLRCELEERLDWRWAGTAQAKRIEQCRIHINGMVLGLWRRGWLLDGKRLADRITRMLDCIALAQRKTTIGDFWAYFQASVTRYVGLNAEEIQAEAMSLGVTSGDVFRQLARSAPASPSLPELIAQRADETLRAKLARQRALEARKAAIADQPQLF